MKTHEDFMPSDEWEGTTPAVGEQFTFHGALVEAVSHETAGCHKCASYKLAAGYPTNTICSEMPPCNGVTFIYKKILNRREYKTWQVLRRMGLDDET
jgi:hypothetical protein